MSTSHTVLGPTRTTDDMAVDNPNFGELLRRAREARGMNQRELSDATKGAVARSYITLLEQGRKTNPTRQVVLRLARALRWPPEEFLVSAGVVSDVELAAKEEEVIHTITSDPRLQPFQRDVLANLYREFVGREPADEDEELEDFE